MTAGQSMWPRDTLTDLLKDHERRITWVERRPQGAVIIEATLAAVQSVDEATDPEVAYYVIDTAEVRLGSTVQTYDAWRAAH